MKPPELLREGTALLILAFVVGHASAHPGHSHRKSSADKFSAGFERGLIGPRAIGPTLRERFICTAHLSQRRMGRCRFARPMIRSSA